MRRYVNDYFYVHVYLKNNTANEPIEFQLMTVYGLLYKI